MSVICKLVSIDGLTKEVIMPKVDPCIRVAWADLPKVCSKYEESMVMDGIKIRTYEYQKTEPIYIYRETSR